MNVTSLKVSEELYKLSGWDSGYWYRDGMVVPRPLNVGDLDTPSYSLDYLIRKLPVRVNGDKYSLVIYKGWHVGKNSEWYTAGYQHINRLSTDLPSDDKAYFITEADNPEDVLGKLCCELTRQGILKR